MTYSKYLLGPISNKPVSFPKLGGISSSSRTLTLQEPDLICESKVTIKFLVGFEVYVLVIGFKFECSLCFPFHLQHLTQGGSVGDEGKWYLLYASLVLIFLMCLFNHNFI